MSMMARAISKNKTLRKVDVCCSSISDQGCIECATALKGKQTIKFIRLWGNTKISNDGFDALADMMSNSMVLERVPLMTPYNIIASVEEVPAHAA